MKIDFDKVTGFDLISCINFLFTSLTDVEAIKDDQEKLDKAELAFRRAMDRFVEITPDRMASVQSKIYELYDGLIAEGAEVPDIDLPEMPEDDE